MNCSVWQSFRGHQKRHNKRLAAKYCFEWIVVSFDIVRDKKYQNEIKVHCSMLCKIANCFVMPCGTRVFHHRVYQKRWEDGARPKWDSNDIMISDMWTEMMFPLRDWKFVTALQLWVLTRTLPSVPEKHGVHYNVVTYLQYWHSYNHER